jgi:hypothetical protein
MCECEHFNHPDRKGVDNGKYHMYFSVPATHVKLTPYGKFLVCEACANDCLSNYPNGD